MVPEDKKGHLIVLQPLELLWSQTTLRAITTWGLSIKIDTTLDSILASSTEKKSKLYTVYSGISLQIKHLHLVAIRWSGGRVQVWDQNWAPNMTINLEGHSGRQLIVLTAKINSQALGTAFWHSFGRSDGQLGTCTDKELNGVSKSHSRCLAATSSLEEKVQTILLYWLRRSKRHKCLVKFGQWLPLYFVCFFLNSKDWFRNCYRPKQRSSLCLVLLSYIGLWAKIRHRNKSTSHESNPVQNSRSK